MFRKFEHTMRSTSSNNILKSAGKNTSNSISPDAVDFEEINQRYPAQRQRPQNILKKRLVSFRKLPTIKNSTQGFGILKEQAQKKLSLFNAP